MDLIEELWCILILDKDDLDLERVKILESDLKELRVLQVLIKKKVFLRSILWIGRHILMSLKFRRLDFSILKH